MLKNKTSFYKIIQNYWPWPILALSLFLTNSQHLIDSDEGIILNAAWNIFNGRKLYLDTFEFIAPGTPYLLALFWKLSYVSYLSAAFLAYLISFSSMVGLFLISYKLKTKRWKFLAPILFIIISSFWPLINHNNFNVAAIIWSIYFLLKGLNDKKQFLFLAGIFSSLAILFTQHKGLVVGTILLIYLIILKLKQKINLSALIFFVSGLILPLISLFIFWSPEILYKTLIIFPLLNYPLTNFLPLTWWLICLMLSLSIIITLWLLSQEKKQPYISLLTVVYLALLVSSITRADIGHIFQAFVILLPLIALLFEHVFQKSADKPITYTLLTIVLFSCFLWPPFDNLGAQNIIKLIRQTCPAKPIMYTGPFMPGLYFELRTLSTTPYSFLITKQQTTEQFNEALNLIKNNPPDCVILSYFATEQFNHNKNNPVDSYFLTNYKMVDHLGKINILLKK